MRVSLQNRTIYVYMFVNRINKRIYVGQTGNPKRREKEHRQLLNNHKHPNRYLQSDFDKMGDVFSLFVIEEIPSSESRNAYKVESTWMRTLKTYDEKHGYNVNDVGVRTII